jgi:hypothetical protein
MTAKKSASVKAKAKTKKATAKKATAKKTPARIASKPKKKAAAAPKTKAVAASKPKKKKAAAAPKAKAKAKAKAKTKALVAKKRVARPRSEAPKVPPARPSDRAMAVVALLPQERALTDEEREAMAKCAQTAHAVLAALAGDGDDDSVPEAIVSSIGGFVDDIRMGRRAEPSSQDIRLGLGVLWGEQVRAQVGWRWVHLSYPNGFASYAVVPDDRAFACFPLNRLTELMRSGADAMNTSVPLFDSIRIGALPARRENAYLVIG